MNWLNNIVEDIRWKAQDFIWAIQDKIQMCKINKQIVPEVEEIEIKPKKKKAKKKSKNKK
jgi:hypothetical protein